MQEPETHEGKIVRIVDRIAYINHDIDDAIRYGILTEADLPHAEIELLGATGSERIDRLVHDLVESSEEAGDIRQSDEIGEAMLSLRAFMFDRVYLGPQVGPEHRRAHDVLQRDLRPARRRAGAAAAGRGRAARADHRLRLGHDRPLRARVRRRARSGADQGQERREVMAAADIVEVVGRERRCARAPARASRAAARSTRSGRRASRSTPSSSSTTASAAARAATSSRFVQETESLDFVGAIEWLAERFRVTLEYEESSPLADEARRRRERLFALLDQATSFFERHLWEAPTGEPVREYLAGRGLGEEISKEFRLGLSPGTGSRRRRARRASRPTRSAPPG